MTITSRPLSWPFRGMATRAGGVRAAPAHEYDPPVTIHVVRHPLAEHLLASLRDVATPAETFRTIAKRLAVAVVLEATRDLPTEEVAIATPIGDATGRRLSRAVVAVPILRAGLGMLEAVTDLFPEVAVGYVGLERDEASLRPQRYYEKLPPVEGRHVIVLDPMLATGGSGAAACAAIKVGSPADVRFACVIAAPEGASRMAADHPDVHVYTAAIDERLDGRGFIVPGLGDFGDRLYGT
jgi:uracil phosphoribosyltransferase